MVSQITRALPDASTSRAAILQAATEVFMESGFSGARVDEIARRASANKAMIYYHFGSKQALYRAVLMSLFSAVLAEIERLEASDEAPEMKLRALYQRIAARFVEIPALPHIMLREILAGGEGMDAEASRVLIVILTFVGKTVGEGVRSGAFRPVDPVLLHMTMMGPLLLHSASVAFRERLRPHAGPGITPPDAQSLVQHLMGVLDRTLAPALPDPSRS